MKKSSICKLNFIFYFIVSLIFVKALSTPLAGLVTLIDASKKILPNTPRIIHASPGPHHGIGIYLINLDRATLRLKNIMPSLKKLHLPIHRIQAYDGKKLSPKLIDQYVDKKTWFKLKWTKLYAGAIGCSISHYIAMQQFLDSTYQYALIFEDDAKFSPKKISSIINQLIKKPELWNLVNLSSYSIYKHHAFTIKHYPNLNLSLQLNQSPTWSASAYLLDRFAAKRLLQTAYPIRLPLDFHIRHDWELGIVSAELWPPAIIPETKNFSYRTTSLVYKDQKPHNDELYTSLSFKMASVYRATYHLKIYLKNILNLL